MKTVLEGNERLIVDACGKRWRKRKHHLVFFLTQISLLGCGFFGHSKDSAPPPPAQPLFNAAQRASERWHQWRTNQARFPIAAWAYFGKYRGTAQEYKTYADCNLTYVTAPVSQYESAVAAGLKVIVGFNERLPTNPALLDKRIQMSIESKGNISGYLLWDEPEMPQLDGLARAMRAIYRKDTTITLPIIDMLPNWAWQRKNGRVIKYGRHYDEFVDVYLKKAAPPVLLCCHYPPLADGGDRPEYYANYEMYRDYALRRDIGLMAFVEAVEYLGTYRPPSDSDLRWQVYSPLAYGAQGIWYWNWRLRPDREKKFAQGMVSHETGEPLREYHIIKEINAELLAIGGVLLKLRSVNVFHSGDAIPMMTRKFEDTSLSGCSALRQFFGQQFLIGEFRNQDDAADGDAYFMIVNKRHGANLPSSDPSLQASAVFLPSIQFKQVHRYDPKTGQPIRVEGITHNGKKGFYSIALPGGQGMLVRLSR